MKQGEQIMLEKSDTDFKLNPDILDRFDYLIAKMKEAGIYANIDVMASRIGWSHGYSWEAKQGDNRNFKLDIHFQPEVRENWKTGFRTLLTHVNPYTGTRLLDDPVLAIAVAYNEQEFGWGRENFGQAADAWRAFLKHRYGTIDALKKAWGEPAAGYADFNEITPFNVAQIAENSPRGADLARFIAEREDELAKWYQETAHGEYRAARFPGQCAEPFLRPRNPFLFAGEGRVENHPVRTAARLPRLIERDKTADQRLLSPEKAVLEAECLVEDSVLHLAEDGVLRLRRRLADFPVLLRELRRTVFEPVHA